MRNHKTIGLRISGMLGGIFLGGIFGLSVVACINFSLSFANSIVVITATTLLTMTAGFSGQFTCRLGRISFSQLSAVTNNQTCRGRFSRAQ